MFTGSIVALITPFQHDRIHLPHLKALVDFHLNAGTQAIVAAGTTGESGTLSHTEKCQVIEAVIEAVQGRVPVIAGTACIATKDCVELTAEAKALGAAASLIMTPAYVRPTQEGLYAHYSRIAEAVDLPMILYNVPSRTACDLQPETVGRLLAHPQVIGIKDATGQRDRLAALLALPSDTFHVYSGDDLTAAEWLLGGAKGVISVTANVVPKLLATLCELALSGKQAEAQALQTKLMPLHQALFCESNPIPVKWAMAQLGFVSDEVRLPLTPLSDSHHEALRVILKQLAL